MPLHVGLPAGGNAAHTIHADGEWRAPAGTGGVTDHGALTGLADDDHPQYLTQTEAGILYQPIGAGGSDPWSYVRLTSNFVQSAVAFAAVTGIAFTGLANAWYEVEVFGAYRAAATTTGMALALDVPALAAVLGSNIVHTSATAAGAAQQLADATTTGASTGVATANSDTPVIAKFLVVMGATPGLVQLMLRSEIAASAVTLQANRLFMKWRALP